MKRQRAARTVEVQEPLLDSDESGIQQRKKRPRPSLILRILNAIKWIIIAVVVSYYFEALQGINKILEEDNWKRKLFFISLLALLIMLLIFMYLQFYIPITKKVSSPNYSLWNTDETLKKFIPIAAFSGLVGVIGLLISSWHIWGFFGTPLVIFSILTSIVNVLNIK